MRKTVVFLCLVLALFLFSGCNRKITTENRIPKQYTHGIYEVTFSAYTVCNESVGENWKETYLCEGREISSGERWTIPLTEVKTLEIDVTATETDKWPDTGKGSLSVLLQDGVETSAIITIIENKGKYCGNKAQRKIVCRVRLVEKLDYALKAS